MSEELIIAATEYFMALNPSMKREIARFMAIDLLTEEPKSSESMRYPRRSQLEQSIAKGA